MTNHFSYENPIKNDSTNNYNVNAINHMFFYIIMYKIYIIIFIL